MNIHWDLLDNAFVLFPYRRGKLRKKLCRISFKDCRFAFRMLSTYFQVMYSTCTLKRGMHAFGSKAKFIALEGTGKKEKREFKILIENSFLVIVILENNFVKWKY